MTPNSQRQTRSDYCRQSAVVKELEEQIAKTAGLAKEPGEPPGCGQPKHLRVPQRTVAELEKEVLRGLADEVPGACAAARSDSADDHDGAALFDGTDATLFHRAGWAEPPRGDARGCNSSAPGA